MSRTSLAAIGDKAATTWKNLELCVLICFRENWASNCANQSSGSEGQNGGIFTVTAFVATASFQTDVDGPPGRGRSCRHGENAIRFPSAESQMW